MMAQIDAILRFVWKSGVDFQKLMLKKLEERNGNLSTIFGI